MLAPFLRGRMFVKASFKTHDDLMDHICIVHLPERQKQQSTRPEVNKSVGTQEQFNENRRPPLCRNGANCIFHSQYRCNFYHQQPPQQQQVRPQRQAPSYEWKTVQNQQRYPHQGNQVRKPHGQNAQGNMMWNSPPEHKYWGSNLAPWCQHGNQCPMGRYCLLRHKNEVDFSSLSYQGRQ